MWWSGPPTSPTTTEANGGKRMMHRSSFHEKKTCLTSWLRDSVWPGMGLFGESYLLFSIGTLKPIWERLFPDCFAFEDCPKWLIHSLTYSVVVGVIVGMLVIGYLADNIVLGRRKGSIVTAMLMSGGALGLFLATYLPRGEQQQDDGSFTAKSLYQVSSVLLFVFGVGVGGEYPLSAASASEQAMMLEEVGSQHQLSTDDSPPTTNSSRGRKVQLVFAMQGMGVWFNSIVLLILIWFSRISGRRGDVANEDDDNDGNDSYSNQELFQIWRWTYGIAVMILGGVLVSRILYLKESKVWANDKQLQQREEKLRVKKKRVSSANQEMKVSCPTIAVSDLSRTDVDEAPTTSYGLVEGEGTYQQEGLYGKWVYVRLLLKHFGGRLVGTSLVWLLWDVSFYGNKLFQSSFILAITGKETTLLEFAFAATLNSSVALLGYYGAAFLVDLPSVGRLRLQCMGFLVTGSLFIACGYTFELLSSRWLVALYLASSFFGQLGPNATTFLIPAEVFPTEARSMCHGISAAFGKIGALVAAIIFNFARKERDLFLVSGYASFVACAITVCTIPDTTGLNGLELDRKWRLIRQNRKNEYSGEANDPQYQSRLERVYHSE